MADMAMGSDTAPMKNFMNPSQMKPGMPQQPVKVAKKKRPESVLANYLNPSVSTP